MTPLSHPTDAFPTRRALHDPVATSMRPALAQDIRRVFAAHRLAPDQWDVFREPIGDPGLMVDVAQTPFFIGPAPGIWRHPAGAVLWTPVNGLACWEGAGDMPFLRAYVCFAQVTPWAPDYGAADVCYDLFAVGGVADVVASLGALENLPPAPLALPPGGEEDVLAALVASGVVAAVDVLAALLGGPVRPRRPVTLRHTP